MHHIMLRLTMDWIDPTRWSHTKRVVSRLQHQYHLKMATNTGVQASPTHCTRNSGLGPHNLCFSKPAMWFWFLFKFENRCLGTSSDKNSILISIWLPPPSKGLICHLWLSCYRDGQFSQCFMSFSSSCPSLLSVLMPRQPAPPYLLAVFLGLLQTAQWCSAASLNCWCPQQGSSQQFLELESRPTWQSCMYRQGVPGTRRELLQSSMWP